MLMYDVFFHSGVEAQQLLLMSNSRNMFVLQNQRKRISNLKIFALLNAAQLTEPMRKNSASVPQRIQNTASGKEKK